MASPLIPPVDDNLALGERRELLEGATSQFDLVNARSLPRKGQRCSRRALYLDALAVVGNVVPEAAVSSSGRSQFVRQGIKHGLRVPWLLALASNPGVDSYVAFVDHN